MAVAEEEEKFLEESEDESQDKSQGATNQVYVSGIAYKATEADLKRFFADCGDIQLVKYPIDEAHKGTAFITFSSLTEAQEAVDLHGATVMGRKLVVKHRHKGHLSKKPKNCKLIFVSNLNFKTNMKEVREHFTDCGEISEIRIPENNKGFRHGIAYVEFTSTQSVDKSIKKHGTMLMDREISVNWALPDKTTKIKKQLKDSHTIFMANLPFNYSVDAIRTWMSQLGSNVDNCRIRLQKRPDGKSKGQCFVDFEDTEDFFKVLKQNDTVLSGRRIRVNVSLPKDKSNKRKREEGEKPISNKKKKLFDKIPETRQMRSLIIHGAPRSLEYEAVQSMFSSHKPESFSRLKGSLMVTFAKREAMGLAIESVNGFIRYNSTSLKVSPTIEKNNEIHSVEMLKVGKENSCAEVHRALEDKFTGISFIYRKKKKFVCETDDVETRRSLLDCKDFKVANDKIIFRKC